MTSDQRSWPAAYSAPAGGVSSSRAGVLTSPGVKLVNLDVTTLVCLVSNVCHGGAGFTFDETELTAQATAERTRPVLPALTGFMQGKCLLMCETVARDFQSILAHVGGAREKARAEELLKTVIKVQDAPSHKFSQLRLTAKVKDGAKVVFCTGDRLGAVTTTANASFVRSAKEQGVDFDVFLHEARALTERKEATATPLEEPNDAAAS